MNFKKISVLLKFFINLFFSGSISLKKTYNLFLNFFHSICLSGNASKFPSVLVIEPTDLCNLQCAGCGYSISLKKNKNFLKLDEFKKIVDDSKDYVICILLYLAGEPFLNKDLIKMIQYAAENKIGIILSTNGNFTLSENWSEDFIRSRCHLIIFSVSGLTQQTYEKYHRSGKIEKINGNIKSLISTKKKLKSKFPYIKVRYLITQNNSDEIKPAEKYYTELGVDEFETRKALTQIKVDFEKNEEIECVNISKSYLEKIKNFCFWLWYIMVIKSNGDVLPCCYEFFGIPRLDNIKNTPINKVWNSKIYNDFRKQVLEKRKVLKCCKNCSSTFGFQDDSFDKDKEIIL